MSLPPPPLSNLSSRILRHAVLDLGPGFSRRRLARWVEGDSGRWVCINCRVGPYHFAPSISWLPNMIMEDVDTLMRLPWNLQTCITGSNVETFESMWYCIYNFNEGRTGITINRKNFVYNTYKISRTCSIKTSTGTSHSCHK